MSTQESSSRRERKIRFWHVAVVILGVLIVAFVVFRLVMRAGVDGRIKAMHEAGYPATLTELNEWYALPPFAENAADRITRAFACLQLPAKQDMEDIPLLGGAKLPDRGEPLDEDTVAQIGEILQNNEAALKLLREGAAIPHCRYPVDFTQGYACQLPHIEHFRGAGRLLCLEALWRAQQGQLEEATDAALTSLAVADSLKAEPVLISQLVRRACWAQTLSTLEFLLNQTAFEREQLTQLDRALAADHDPNAMARALAAERCFGHAAFSRPTEAGLSGSSGAPMRVLVAGQRAIGLHDASWAIFLDLMDEYIRAVQLPPWQRQGAAEFIEAKLQAVSRIHIMVHLLLPACGRVIQLDTESWARNRTARVAVALERHRLATGDLPEKLSDLVPAYLPAIPQDPFDGKPLRYKQLDAGFVVYSIGPDRQDDGGTERPARRKSREPESKYDVTFIIER
ncbi:MAG: hypothetical protein JW741_22520 [Sedimentisphaerales bacterium]|nr:hypothetical protein [Sedimentisphaerales bacterium]